VTRARAVALTLARIPRAGSLHDDIYGESAMLVKKLRPLLVDYRLGAVIRALFTLAAEYSTQLLRAEHEGCDCTHDVPNGLFRCDSSTHHAVTEIVIEEKNESCKRN
jgi:hypothetical protein